MPGGGKFADAQDDGVLYVVVLVIVALLCLCVRVSEW